MLAKQAVNKARITLNNLIIDPENEFSGENVIERKQLITESKQTADSLFEVLNYLQLKPAEIKKVFKEYKEKTKEVDKKMMSIKNIHDFNWIIYLLCSVILLLSVTLERYVEENEAQS